MNVLFKALLSEVADLAATGKAVASKADFPTLLPLLIKDAEDAPSIVSNWGDLKNEAQALISNPSADADLLAYATTLAGGSADRGAQIVVAAATLVLNGVVNTAALISAIKA